MRAATTCSHEAVCGTTLYMYILGLGFGVRAIGLFLELSARRSPLGRLRNRFFMRHWPVLLASVIGDPNSYFGSGKLAL